MLHTWRARRCNRRVDRLLRRPLHRAVPQQSQSATAVAPDLVRPALRKLDRLTAARISDFRTLPGIRLVPLRIDLRTFWSIRINDPWRSVFRWDSGNALNIRTL
ncbi:MAG: type II toxin-antitoxin system RelE/ParE family toxin [Phycisphaerae bacterium]|nr:type II toxin-antitoxin system RelE/ParE family toxin [Phycisphaerae bacterium]